MGVQDIDGSTPQESAHPVHILQPGPQMEMGIELETLEQGDASLTGEILNLTPGRNTEDDLLLPLNQAPGQHQHWLRCPRPPSIAQKV
jgi:hypothetical protein